MRYLYHFCFHRVLGGASGGAYGAQSIGGGRQEKTSDARRAPHCGRKCDGAVGGMLDSSAAIMGPAASDIGPAQLLHLAMEKYGVLEQCGREYERAQSKGEGDEEKTRIAQDEAVAVAEAVHAIRALNAGEARKKLEG